MKAMARTYYLMSHKRKELLNIKEAACILTHSHIRLDMYLVRSVSFKIRG